MEIKEQIVYEPYSSHSPYKNKIVQSNPKKQRNIRCQQKIDPTQQKTLKNNIPIKYSSLTPYNSRKTLNPNLILINTFACLHIYEQFQKSKISDYESIQLLFQCQNIQHNKRMKKLKIKPDSQSHLHLHILNRDIDINFRYYSPSKSASSQSIASQEKIPLSESSSMLNDMASVFPKKTHDPKQMSEKFYQFEMLDARNSIMNYYEKFHNRLLEPHVKPIKMENPKRITRLNLSTNKKSIKNKSPPLKEIRNKVNKNQRKSYVKRAQINLISKKQNEIPVQLKKTGESKSLSKEINKSNGQVSHERKARLKIMLYDDKISNINQDQGVNNSYKTPRTSSRHKKGIRVFSSASTKKNQDSQYFTQPETKKPARSAFKNRQSLSRQKNTPLNISRRSVSRFNEGIGKGSQRKKRIFSKQKLGKSEKPKIFLYQENH